MNVITSGNATIGILTVIGIVFTLIASSYILRSILLSVRLRDLSPKERLEIYIKNKFDIKWPIHFLIAFCPGIVVASLVKINGLVQLNVIFVVFFSVILWGNIHILKLRKETLANIRSRKP